VGEIGNLFNLVFTFPIFNGLVVLYNLFGDFGLAIVVLTLIIKLVLFPLTLQQLKSMKATQALNPLLQEIRKKYANDQQAQMQATQALYKEYGVNPLSGCLPLVVQLPVLYGLYYALSTVVRTSNLEDVNVHIYPFIPHFIKFPDLTFRWFEWLSFVNPLFHLTWSWTFPLNAPDPSHVLPIIAGLATFVQLRMSQPNAAAVASKPSAKSAQPDPTAQTMKTMQYVMPLFTVFIGWSFPAGLALYWTVSSMFQAVQQYFVTGWGSLLTKPTLTKEVSGSAVRVTSSNGSSKNGSSNGKIVDALPARRESVKSVSPIQDDVEVDEEDVDDDDDGRQSVEAKARTTPRPVGSGPAQYSRRQRGGSASARRRSGAQRSRR
jgi:YidC/Oxa1 family membrane protein insertase